MTMYRSIMNDTDLKTDPSAAQQAADALKKGASGYAKSQTSELASLAPVPGNMDYDSLTAAARGVLEKWNDCITNEAKKIISIDKTLHESDRTNAQRFR